MPELPLGGVHGHHKAGSTRGPCPPTVPVYRTAHLHRLPQGHCPSVAQHGWRAAGLERGGIGQGHHRPLAGGSWRIENKPENLFADEAFGSVLSTGKFDPEKEGLAHGSTWGKSEVRNHRARHYEKCDAHPCPSPGFCTSTAFVQN